MAEKKKRTLAVIKKFVATEAAKDDLALKNPKHVPDHVGGGGRIITGPHLQAAAPAIDLIPDITERRHVHGLFSTFAKYQTLAMLLDERGKWFSKYPEIMEQIAERATEADAAALTSSSMVGRAGDLR